jgi:outer membrane lipoprotein carrier protein
MRNKLFLFVVLSAGLSFGSTAQERPMSQSEILAFKQTVAVTSKKIKTLSADFVQYKHMDFLSKDIESSGKMIFKEPAKLLWQYKKPYNYSVVFRNDRILINDEGKTSKFDVGSSEIFGKLNNFMVRSVSGDLFNDKEFVITYIKAKNYYRALLIPRDAALKKYIKQIEMTFGKDADLSEVKLFESAEDYTRIVFINKQLNGKIDESVFNN